MRAISDTREWVDGLPSDTLFRIGDVPGEAPLRNQVLSRVAKGDTPVLEHVTRGIYYKRSQPHPGCTVQGSRTAWRKALCWAAGNGGGLAGWLALNAHGWTTQVPSRLSVATLKRKPPTIFAPHTQWLINSLWHRQELTWGEVSLIEAVKQWLPQDDYPWEFVLQSLYERAPWDANSGGRMPRDTVLRADALADAIAFEEPNPVEALCYKLSDRNSGPPLDVRLTETVGALRASGL